MSRQRAAASPVKLAMVAPVAKPTSDSVGKTQQLKDPFAGGFLDRGGGGRGETQPRILVPGAEQPVRGQGGRQCAADDPAEEPPGRHGHQPGFGLGREIVHHLRGRHPLWGQRAAEVGRELGRRGLRSDPACFLALKPPACVPGRGVEGIPVAFLTCRHSCMLRPAPTDRESHAGAADLVGAYTSAALGFFKGMVERVMKENAARAPPAMEAAISSMYLDGYVTGRVPSRRGSRYARLVRRESPHNSRAPAPTASVGLRTRGRTADRSPGGLTPPPRVARGRAR